MSFQHFALGVTAIAALASTALLGLLVMRSGGIEAELDSLNRRAQVVLAIDRQLTALRDEGIWVHGAPLAGDDSSRFETELEVMLGYTPLFVEEAGVKLVEVLGTVRVDGTVDAFVTNGGRFGVRVPLQVEVVNSSSDPVPVVCVPNGLFGRGCPSG